MDIRELIAQDEGAKLDFKREWYKEADLKTEFIKDIIALTNGNIHTIGQPSFLIIGVKENPNGNVIHHVELNKTLDEIKQQLIQNLQNFATPSIQDIEMEFFEIESKNILVIQIPFHPYLIILKNKIRQYEKDNLLYRAGEGTVIADYPTRRAFDDKMSEYNKTNPLPSPNLITITNNPPKKENKELTKLPEENKSFVGREEDLEEIEKNLNSDSVVCVVNGIGGVGKSELSYKYLHNHKDKYKKIAFIEMTEDDASIENVFRREFQDSLFLNAEDNLATIMRRLQALPPKNLLLLDNLQSNDDYELIKSLNSKFDILITTREDIDTDNILPLDVLNDRDAKKMFLDIFETDEDIDDILEYLDNHPLFIKLIAFSLKRKYIRLENLIVDIQKGEISKIRSKDKKTFKVHLQNTFNRQFENEQDSKLKNLLQVLALFPAIEIDLKMLEKILGDERIEGELQFLVNSGWLINKENSYKLHQIIKTFILEEHSIKYEDITYILENIGRYIDPYDDIIVASQLSDYIPIIDSLLTLFENREDEHIATILDSNTYLYYSLGEYDNSLKIQNKSYEIREKLFGKESEITARSYDLLGVIYDKKGKYDKAKALYQRALKIREKILGENHPDTASTYNNLAELYKSKEEYSKAEPLYKKALKIYEELLGDSHPDTALSYNNLAGLYDLKGEYDKAEPLYKKALKIREKILGGSHPDTAHSYNNLATLYHSKGEYSKAEPLYKKALKICEEVLGESHPDTALSYNNLAELYKSKEEYSKAEPLYKKALKIREKVLGESHPDTALSYNNLALFYKDRKQCSKAKEFFEKCIKVVEELDFFGNSLIELRRWLKKVNDNIKKEKKAKFNQKGRYCSDYKHLN